MSTRPTNLVHAGWEVLATFEAVSTPYVKPPE
jgi:hypothetical protein